MHACHSINAMPLRLVGEVCRGKGNMSLEHPCKAFLLVVGRRSEMNCPSHVGCPIPILCPTVHQVKLVPCDPSCSLFSWSVVDNCPVWPNRAGKSGFIFLKYIWMDENLMDGKERPTKCCCSARNFSNLSAPVTSVTCDMVFRSRAQNSDQPLPYPRRVQASRSTGTVQQSLDRGMSRNL